MAAVLHLVISASGNAAVGMAGQRCPLTGASRTPGRLTALPVAMGSRFSLFLYIKKKKKKKENVSWGNSARSRFMEIIQKA